MDKARYHKNLDRFSTNSFLENKNYPKRYCYILTNLCNLACTFCFQERKKQDGAMTYKDWVRLTDELPKNSRVTLTGGEPLAFKEFREIFDHVVSKFECNIITNGLLLNEELIDFMLQYKNLKVLSISIDNRKNTIRKSANVQETKWDEKWIHVEKMMHYFQKIKKQSNNKECVLDVKTVILDENASDLLDIHKYCVDELNCDTHAFQFLKGSPIQHADIMFDLKKIFEKSKAYVYKNWDIIVDQLKQVRDYNLKNKKFGALHPAVTSIMENDMVDISHLNNANYDKNLFKACAAPWGSVHINVDGTLFPCLAINLGNVKDGLKKIIYGERYLEFKNIIKKNGTVEACNRCGWLKPLN